MRLRVLLGSPGHPFLHAAQLAASAAYLLFLRIAMHEWLHCQFHFARSSAQACTVEFARIGGWLPGSSDAKGVAYVPAIPWYEHPVIYLLELGIPLAYAAVAAWNLHHSLKARRCPV